MTRKRFVKLLMYTHGVVISADAVQNAISSIVDAIPRIVEALTEAIPRLCDAINSSLPAAIAAARAIKQAQLDTEAPET